MSILHFKIQKFSTMYQLGKRERYWCAEKALAIRKVN